MKAFDPKLLRRKHLFCGGYSFDHIFYTEMVVGGQKWSGVSWLCVARRQGVSKLNTDEGWNYVIS